MTPPPLILRRVPVAPVLPRMAAPIVRRVQHLPSPPVVAAFQVHTRSVLDYLLGTLLKTW